MVVCCKKNFHLLKTYIGFFLKDFGSWSQFVIAVPHAVAPLSSKYLNI